MKQRLTSSRSTDISILFPHILGNSITFFFLVIAVIFTVVLQVAHSKDGCSVELDLTLDHHKDMVENFKTKVLKHMGLNSPPSDGGIFNISGNSMNGKLIRKYLREKLDNSDDDYELYEDKCIGDPKTLEFRSKDSRADIPVYSAETATSLSDLTTIRFNTRFQQPEVPYHDLVIKSAILRMRINQQKGKLRRRSSPSKEPLTVQVYLLENTQGRRFKNHSTAKLVSSITINTSKSKIVKMNIEPSLLSHITALDNARVIFGIEIKRSPFVDTKKQDKVNLTHKESQDLSIPKIEKSHQKSIRISKAKLQVSIQTRNLRVARYKRQVDPDCLPGLCCRQSIYVNFDNIGWNWVLSPEGYTAYICKGACPKRYKSASTFTNIKSLLHERNSSLVPAATCAPSGYSSITLTVLHSDVEERNFPDMLVNGCRCY